jgi:thiol:disulfide interchange protein
MRLERDEFVITYDETKATPKILIATIRKSGYTAQVITGKDKVGAADTTPAELPQGFALLDEALKQAKSERKPIVLDFSAEWCAPCKRMEKTTFADAKVKELLQRCILVRIDVDQHEELAQRLGVVGLPDLRFVTPEGKVFQKLRGYQFPDSFAADLARLIQSVEH